MGDEVRAGEQSQRQVGIYEHWCEHVCCQEWHSWSYSRIKTETRWFCYEHRAEALLG